MDVLGLRVWLKERFDRLEHGVLNFHAGAQSVEQFLERTEGPVRLSAVARGSVPTRVGIELLARANQSGFLGRKWLLRHEHELTDFETESGTVGHPSQDLKTYYEELRLPMQNANAFLPHLARRIESRGRLAEYVVDDWSKSFDEVQAERKAAKTKKRK